MNTELQTSIVAKINEEHGAFIALGERSTDALLAQLNKAREIGIHLAGLKKTLRHGEFSHLFSVTSEGVKNITPALCFSQKHGCEFMRFAAAHPDPIATVADGVRCLKDALILSGALPEPHRDTQQQAHGTLGVFAKMKSCFMDGFSIFNKEAEKQPVEQWPSPRLQDIVTTFAPARDIVERAERALAERSEKA